MVRLASSSAISLGINMRSVDHQTNQVSKETRSRLWHAIFLLETLLNTMAGRSPSLGAESSLDPPFPFPEASFAEPFVSQLLRDHSRRAELLNWTLFELEVENKARTNLLTSMQPSPELYYFYQADLAMIMNSIANWLYTPDALHRGWVPIKDAINFYSRKLDSWLSIVSSQYSFPSENDERPHTTRTAEEVSLALSYYSACIALNRPCLSRPNHGDGLHVRHSISNFGKNTAGTCIRAALSLLAVLPHEADADWLYTMSPWWSTLHFIMKATTVLLIRLSVGSLDANSEDGSAEPMIDAADSEDAPEVVLTGCRKALHWLHRLGEGDLACRRGFELCYRLFRRLAQVRNFSLGSVPWPASMASSHWNSPTQNFGVSEEQYDAMSLSDDDTRVLDQCEPSGAGVGVTSAPFWPYTKSDIDWFLSVAQCAVDDTSHLQDFPC